MAIHKTPSPGCLTGCSSFSSREIDPRNSPCAESLLPETQVESQMRAVDEAVNRIHKAAHGLADRIARVTAERNEKDDGCCPPQCTLVPLADNLRNFADRLNDTAQFIEGVTARVEL